MGAAAGLQIDHGFGSPDLNQPHSPCAGRRLHRHRLDQAGIGGQFGIADPAVADRQIPLDQRVELTLDDQFILGRVGHVEIEPPLFGGDRAAGHGQRDHDR